MSAYLPKSHSTDMFPKVAGFCCCWVCVWDEKVLCLMRVSARWIPNPPVRLLVTPELTLARNHLVKLTHKIGYLCSTCLRVFFRKGRCAYVRVRWETVVWKEGGVVGQERICEPGGGKGERGYTIEPTDERSPKDQATQADRAR